ncbi:MAG TPA: UvrB/UvrC motif-containing protein [Chloroflexota bacterium]|nr:UvrB/UvrC motif-containing protein [Chloroflexota bacterium]
MRKVAEEKAVYDAEGVREIPRDELARLIKDLESQMKTASKSLEFERAALLRDQIVELRRDLQGDSLLVDPRKLVDGVPQPDGVIVVGAGATAPSRMPVGAGAGGGRPAGRSKRGRR